jgi:hypothetical protein
MKECVNHVYETQRLRVASCLCILHAMSSPKVHPKLDFKDNTTLRIIHEANLQDLLQARNYVTLQLLEEHNALLRERYYALFSDIFTLIHIPLRLCRENLGATKINYTDYDFITLPKPDALLPYTIFTHSLDSPPKIIPFRASRPSWAYYPVDVSISYCSYCYCVTDSFAEGTN